MTIKHWTEASGQGHAIMWPSDEAKRQGAGYVDGWIGTGCVVIAERHELTKQAMRQIAERFESRVRVMNSVDRWEVEYTPATDGYELFVDGQPVIITGRMADPSEADILANR